jgi:hypothetical protein
MLIVEAYLNTLHICRIGTNASLHKRGRIESLTCWACSQEFGCVTWW